MLDLFLLCTFQPDGDQIPLIRSTRSLLPYWHLMFDGLQQIATSNTVRNWISVLRMLKVQPRSCSPETFDPPHLECSSIPLGRDDKMYLVAVPDQPCQSFDLESYMSFAN
jgi:hypothetical protein